MGIVMRDEKDQRSAMQHVFFNKKKGSLKWID